MEITQTHKEKVAKRKRTSMSHRTLSDSNKINNRLQITDLRSLENTKQNTSE
jgi:hypothetical protein